MKTEKLSLISRKKAIAGILLTAVMLISSCGNNAHAVVEAINYTDDAAISSETTDAATYETTTETTEITEVSETSESSDMIYAYADTDDPDYTETSEEQTETEKETEAEETTDTVADTEETTAPVTEAEETTTTAQTTAEVTTAPVVSEKKPETAASGVTASVTAGADGADNKKKNTFVSILGPNMLYVGESFDYKYYIGNKTSKRVSAFWEFKGDSATFEKSGKMTAVKKGDVELTLTDVSDGISTTLIIHCVESPDDVDFIVKVNGIPIANKTYPVPKNYNPGGLTAETQKAYNELVAAAKNDGINITFISGFRSYNEQVQVYKRWADEYGQAADRVSARPGHSEHQLGLAIDVNSIWMEFADTPEAKWLAAHCHEYGFILRYPSYAAESITGYAYEPWHIRYLGKDIAAMVHESGLTLEECLGIDSYYRVDDYKVQ